MESMEFNLVAIISLVVQSGFLTVAYRLYTKYQKQMEERNKQTAARDEAIRSLLRTEIISIYHKAEEKGYMPIYNLENITDMYQSYKALGGNGAITEIYHKSLNFSHNDPAAKECSVCSTK